eukprot:TRINITY_DN7705_c0_g1_i3.p1 TRINITY_DN7705_c0_g1~~TRINITY_DN7705_c0_g1_i3.p1  ORF type:complete len:466 (+),score=36.03 TRINITY_DN7705_c0_g1_i3:38-1399(+)
MPSRATRKRHRDRRKALKMANLTKKPLPLPSKATWLDSLGFQTYQSVGHLLEHMRPMYSYVARSVSTSLKHTLRAISDKVAETSEDALDATVPYRADLKHVREELVAAREQTATVLSSLGQMQMELFEANQKLITKTKSTAKWTQTDALPETPAIVTKSADPVMVSKAVSAHFQVETKSVGVQARVHSRSFGSPWHRRAKDSIRQQSTRGTPRSSKKSAKKRQKGSTKDRRSSLSVQPGSPSKAAMTKVASTSVSTIVARGPVPPPPPPPPLPSTLMKLTKAPAGRPALTAAALQEVALKAAPSPRTRRHTSAIITAQDLQNVKLKRQQVQEPRPRSASVGMVSLDAVQQAKLKLKPVQGQKKSPHGTPVRKRPDTMAGTGFTPMLARALAVRYDAMHDRSTSPSPMKSHDPSPKMAKRPVLASLNQLGSPASKKSSPMRINPENRRQTEIWA